MKEKRYNSAKNETFVQKKSGEYSFSAIKTIVYARAGKSAHSNIIWGEIRDSYINQFKQSQKMFGDALVTTVSEVISQSQEWCAQNNVLKFFELQLFQNCFTGGSYRKLLASCHTYIKDGEIVADQGFFKPFLGVKTTP